MLLNLSAGNFEDRVDIAGNFFAFYRVDTPLVAVYSGAFCAE